MTENKNPNRVLAEKIAFEMKAKDLILENNEESLVEYLAEGKMKDWSWKKVLENKINSQLAPDET
jgi:hypothetical protein